MSTFTIVNSTLTMTSGNVDLGTFTLSLGTSAAATGTLSYTSGWLYNGDLIRWLASPVIPDGNVRGLFPMGSSSNTRPFYVSFPAVVPTTGGIIRVGHTGATSVSTLSVADTGGPIVRRQDSFWQVSTGTLAGGTYNLRGEGTGLGTVGNVADLRLMLAGSVVGTAGTNAGTLTDPQVLRTGLTLANLTNTFYIGSVNAVNSPLPITLIDFHGTPDKGGIILKWATASEVNSSYFELERSKDGAEFQSIATVSGQGTVSTHTDYSYLDETAFGRNYYRLKSVDFNGSSALSKMILVDAGAAFSVYPNPIVNRKFTVEFSDNDASPVYVVLIDQLGRTYEHTEFENVRQEIELAESIPPGIYFLKISKGRTQKTIKVTIL